MRSNYHNINNINQSEDSVTKISRSKSRNQMVISTKIRDKVSRKIFRKEDGINASTLNRYQSTTTTTNHIRNVRELLK